VLSAARRLLEPALVRTRLKFENGLFRSGHASLTKERKEFVCAFVHMPPSKNQRKKEILCVRPSVRSSMSKKINFFFNSFANFFIFFSIFYVGSN